MPRFKSEVLSYYPGLSPLDTEIWTDYLRDHWREWDGFDYNVRVGNGIEPTENSNPMDDSIWKDLTQLRIDAVGYRGNKIGIIEIKPLANAHAYGQVLTYTQLYRSTYQYSGDIVQMIVCRVLNQDMRGIFETGGIKIEVVQPQNIPA